MPKRLKLVLKTQISALLPLILKTAVFGLFFFLFNSEGGFFWTFVFLIVVFTLYFGGFFQWREFLFSFLIFVVYALNLSGFFSASIYLWLGTLSFSVLFGLLLGIKNLVFINRKRALNFFSGAMYFIAAISFFVSDKTSTGSFLFNYLLSFFAFYFIFKETFRFLKPEFSANKRNLISISMAFIAIEIMAVIIFLPLGFLNATALTILFVFILEDLIFYHIQGRLSRQIILKNTTILLIFTVIIFAISKWTP